MEQFNKTGVVTPECVLWDRHATSGEHFLEEVAATTKLPRWIASPAGSRQFVLQVLSLGVIILPFWAASALGGTADNTSKTSPRTIVIGTESDYSPFSSVDAQGQATGFNVELAKAIARVMGLSTEVKIAPWSHIRSDLADGRIDIIAGMYFSEERSHTVRFSPHYTVVHHAVFARKSSKQIDAESNLYGKRLIVMRGDIMHDYVLQKGITKDIILVDSHADALRLLASGKHDYALLAKLPGLHWIAQLGLNNVTTTGPVLCPSSYCFAAAKDRGDLIDTFSEGLAILKATGEYKSIYDHWLGVYEPEVNWARGILKYAGVVTVALLGVFVLFFIWSKNLKWQVAVKTTELQQELVERERAQEMLRQSDERLTKIIDNTSEIIYMLSLDGVFTFVSPAWPRRLGHDLSEVLGRSFVTFVHPDDVSVCQALLAKVVSTGKPQESVEFRVRHKNGHWCWYRSSGSCINDSQGHPLWFVGIGDDVTERKRVEQVLRESEERYRTLVENIDLGITLIDRQHRVVMVNEGHARMFNRTARECIGQECFRLFGGREAVCPHCPGVQAMRTGLPAKGESQCVRDDGSTFAVHLNAFPILDADGLPTCFIEVVEDISGRKRAEQELVDARSAAEAASRAKSEFLANMSHEIRTPMTAILGFANILLDNANEQDTIESVQIIKRNGNHLLDLVNGILDLSKIEAEKCTVDLQKCSPRQIAADVISLMKVPADAKGLPVTLEVGGGIPEEITTDPTRLRQILVNLIGNAIKFTEVGGVQVVMQLDLRAETEPLLRFDVIDTGIGLSEEQKGTLFQAFSQADTSTTRRFGGTGLGLAISKRLARMLGGNITVSSVLGKGATFSVSIAVGPLDDTKPPQRRADADEPSVAAQGGSLKLNCRILLAEDGPDNQRLIAFLLRKAGAEVTLVENGQMAFDAVSQETEKGEHFDVILMDMQMPVMDGYEATRKLREKGYRRAIVALTAHAMKEDRQKCLDAGCDDYVTKPVDRAALLQIVSNSAVTCFSGSGRQP